MKHHMIAFLSGFLLDLILGDPYWLPHPIRLIGNSISILEKKFLGKDDLTEGQKRNLGRMLVGIILFGTGVGAGGILLGAYCVNLYVGCVIESIMTYQILATKCLKVESMKVYDRLCHGTLEEARKAVSMILGRDTNSLREG